MIAVQVSDIDEASLEDHSINFLLISTIVNNLPVSTLSAVHKNGSSSTEKVNSAAGLILHRLEALSTEEKYLRFFERLLDRPYLFLTPFSIRFNLLANIFRDHHLRKLLDKRPVFSQ